MLGKPHKLAVEGLFAQGYMPWRRKTAQKKIFELVKDDPWYIEHNMLCDGDLVREEHPKCVNLEDTPTSLSLILKEAGNRRPDAWKVEARKHADGDGQTVVITFAEVEVTSRVGKDKFYDYSDLALWLDDVFEIELKLELWSHHGVVTKTYDCWQMCAAAEDA